MKVKVDVVKIKSNNEHWNDYWSQGHKTSFGDAFTNCYEGVIKTTWVEYFNTLRDDSKVLDLCTGNASLLRLAKACLNDENNIHFTGVDYADIDTKDDFSQLKNINLVFNVNIEQLPFGSESFDYVISNFGIEYSDLNKSLSEVSRVLSFDGKLEIICHCYDSTIIKSNSNELAMLDLMLSENNVLSNLKILIKALTTRTENKLQISQTEKKNYHIASETAEKIRHKLNESLGIIDNLYTQSLHESGFLTFLKYLLSEHSIDKDKILTSYVLSIQAHQSRLLAMVNAALSKEKINTLDEIFKENDLLLIGIEDVINDGGKIACKISAKKIIKSKC